MSIRTIDNPYGIDIRLFANEEVDIDRSSIDEILEFSKIVEIDIKRSIDLQVEELFNKAFKERLERFFHKWLEKEYTGVTEILEINEEGMLFVLFEKPEEAVQVKLTWG